jgi:hypothetical protein
MPAVTLRAHYDGKRILLDEPFELPPDAALMVTVLSPAVGEDREHWIQAAKAGLARAYGDDEPEYSAADVRP